MTILRAYPNNQHDGNNHIDEFGLTTNNNKRPFPSKIWTVASLSSLLTFVRVIAAVFCSEVWANQQPGRTQPIKCLVTSSPFSRSASRVSTSRTSQICVRLGLKINGFCWACYRWLAIMPGVSKKIFKPPAQGSSAQMEPPVPLNLAVVSGGSPQWRCCRVANIVATNLQVTVLYILAPAQL